MMISNRPSFRIHVKNKRFNCVVDPERNVDHESDVDPQCPNNRVIEEFLIKDSKDITRSQ